MENIKEKFFELLKTIQGNGSFEISGVKKIVLPGLVINGVGEVSIPIPPIQIREIINVSKKAPFGKGSKTITDTTVRSAWEIDADQLSFHNEDWESFMKQIVEKVKEGLGIESSISPSLYKLLVYEEGDFFLMHKDSEKEPGMFGTLIIGLPSAHTGGELVIRFDGKEKVIDFSSSNYKIPYVAFFTDCDHEIKPITSGYRVSLAYNLLQESGSQKLDQSQISTHVDQMAFLLKSMSSSFANRPKAVLLEHQYTPANFSLNSLKHHDRPRAELLLEAAKKAGYFAELGLVTHYQMGSLEGDDYDYYDSYHRHSENSSDGTMGEVYEEYTHIEHWSNGEIPTLGNLKIGKDDLITEFEVGEGDPIEEEEEGYTGNAGMSVEYWYHYGAIILWQKTQHIDLLSSTSVEVRLKWLEYYYQNWDNSTLNSIELSKHIITQFSESQFTEQQVSSANFNIVSAILLKLEDENFILDKCQLMLSVVFKNIQFENWVALLQKYDPKIFTPLFERAANRDDIYSINHVLNILKSAYSNESSSLGLKTFCQYHIEQIPNYLANIQLSKRNETNSYLANNVGHKETIIEVLKKVLELSQYKETDIIWINKTLEIITKSLTRNYVNKVLFIVIQNQKNTLAQKIKQICILNLKERTAIKPTPPINWRREVPNTKHNLEIWQILRPFLESPDSVVFEYKKGETFRSQMQSAIMNVTIDLKMETIKKGSPHVLKITKTQAAYDLALKNWQEDIVILGTLNQMP